MKTKYSTGITDLRQQFDHITSKRIQLYQEHGTDPDNAGSFLILIKRTEIELISNEKKLLEVKVI